jgi:hypothetical protein
MPYQPSSSMPAAYMTTTVISNNIPGACCFYSGSGVVETLSRFFGVNFQTGSCAFSGGGKVEVAIFVAAAGESISINLRSAG